MWSSGSQMYCWAILAGSDMVTLNFMVKSGKCEEGRRT
jgi:hypothetical protein